MPFNLTKPAVGFLCNIQKFWSVKCTYHSFVKTEGLLTLIKLLLTLKTLNGTPVETLSRANITFKANYQDDANNI